MQKRQNPNLRDFDLTEMEALMQSMGEPAYRARQLFTWVHRKGVTSWDQMTDLSAGLRRQLSGQVSITGLTPVACRRSPDGQTVKYAFQLVDNQLVEAVVMAYTRDKARDRVTICVSSQVGCAMGCLFCATGQTGFSRNLSAGEILGQVLEAERCGWESDPDFRISNVVFMGMGEPLANYEQVLKAIQILNHPLGLNISCRRITVSTCGLVPQIRKLAVERLPLVLTVSLHAARDELRTRLLPINSRYPLAELKEACRDYTRLSGRRITFAYILIDGLNDSPADAVALAEYVRGLPANVNLIPFNPVPGLAYNRPSPQRVRQFCGILIDKGVEAVVREEKGGDIEAACGQLRRRLLKGQGEDETVAAVGRQSSEPN